MLNRILTMLSVLFFCSVLSASSSVSDIRIVGSTDYSLPPVLSKACDASHLLCIDAVAPKHIRLMKLKLSKTARARLAKRLRASHARHSKANDSHVQLTASRSKQLGMAGVPVLDQGMHGSCATFANTAAIDALFALHDEAAMSPLCALQLSRTLRPETPYGDWEGATVASVQSYVKQHGYMPMQYQHVSGCGGLKQYPVRSSDIGQPMDEALFEQNSDHRFTAANQDVIVGNNGQLQGESAADLVEQIKGAIKAGHRVVIGAVLDVHIPGIAGAQGRHHRSSMYPDTWMVTPALVDDVNHAEEHNDYFGGHALLITGYDDKACAVSSDYVQACGLFTLRNSWGRGIGHHGDFYMSYNYLRSMVFEAVALKPYTG